MGCIERQVHIVMRRTSRKGQKYREGFITGMSLQMKETFVLQDGMCRQKPNGRYW